MIHIPSYLDFAGRRPPAPPAPKNRKTESQPPGAEKQKNRITTEKQKNRKTESQASPPEKQKNSKNKKNTKNRITRDSVFRFFGERQFFRN